MVVEIVLLPFLRNIKMHKTYAYLFSIYGSFFEGEIIILAKDINTASDNLKQKMNCNVSSCSKISDEPISDLSVARSIAKQRGLLNGG